MPRPACCTAALTQARLLDHAGARGTQLRKGDVVTVSEIKGSRCKVDGKGWVDLQTLQWRAEPTAGGGSGKFLKICGRKKRCAPAWLASFSPAGRSPPAPAR